MKAFTFVEPDSLSDVLAELGRADGSARVIAGGSDLLGELKEGYVHYERLVSLARSDELRSIERRPDALHLGALVTMAELELGPHLTGPYQILAEAARGVATPEVRHQGTLGGNLCQRPRCLYYRSALTPCLKKGGDGCPASESPFQNYLSIMGGPHCYAVHASDLAPPLLALGARVAIEGASGRRELPIEAFFTGPEVDPARETVLEPGEVLTEVILPVMPANWRGVYTKGRERTAGDFAIVSVALGYELVEGRIRDCRLVLGGVAPAPWRSNEAESALEGRAPAPEVAAEAASAALAGATPLAHNAFKVDLAKALIERGVLRLAN